MVELKGIESVSPEIKEPLSRYCREMVSLHGKNLRSIILYGSATGPDFVHKRSNINLMLILDDVTQSSLQRSLKVVAKGRKMGIVAPLFLSEDHIRRSADVFPIEFLDIQENHLVLYGDDPFEELEIDRSNIRLQCEHELKGKLIRLRQGYLERGLLKKGIATLLTESLTSFIPIFRNMLRLKGLEPPKHKKEVIEKTAEVFGVSARPFLKILELKRAKRIPDAKGLDALLADYLVGLDRLAVIIDEM